MKYLLTGIGSIIGAFILIEGFNIIAASICGPITGDCRCEC